MEFSGYITQSNNVTFPTTFITIPHFTHRGKPKITSLFGAKIPIFLH